MSQVQTLDDLRNPAKRELDAIFSAIRGMNEAIAIATQNIAMLTAVVDGLVGVVGHDKVEAQVIAIGAGEARSAFSSRPPVIPSRPEGEKSIITGS